MLGETGFFHRLAVAFPKSFIEFFVSFVLVTGGISLIVLALSYYWIDGLNHRGNLKFFTIVGMYSIFITSFSFLLETCG